MAGTLTPGTTTTWPLNTLHIVQSDMEVWERWTLGVLRRELLN